MNELIVSLFPGIGMLDRAFEDAGYVTVRGPDILWGGDIRTFHLPPDVFWGVIGGPPCQDFSGLRRCDPTGYGEEMLNEFTRCVTEASPEWWLMENVARVPNVTIPGYVTQRLDINAGWYSDQTRLRHIQFGSKSGRLLNVTRRQVTGTQPAALANDNRSFRELCRLQGLPDDYDLPGFLVSEKIRAVGNGVPLSIGRVLAEEIQRVYRDQAQEPPLQLGFNGVTVRNDVCACGCGRVVTGKRKYYDYSCRKRAQRKRDKGSGVTDQSRLPSAL